MQGGKGKASCQLCSPGKFTSAFGQVMCTSCPAEYYRPEEPEEPEESQLEDSKESKRPNNHSNTTTNTTRRVPASSCFECEIGRTTNGGTSSSSCTACGAGKYGKRCQQCGPGKFRPISSYNSSALPLASSSFTALDGRYVHDGYMWLNAASVLRLLVFSTSKINMLVWELGVVLM
jgi:hypothetical protein